MKLNENLTAPKNKKCVRLSFELYRRCFPSLPFAKKSTYGSRTCQPCMHVSVAIARAIVWARITARLLRTLLKRWTKRRDRVAAIGTANY